MKEGKAAIYLRLSREDTEQDGESQSIGNQRAFLLQYAEKHALKVVEVIADDGFSGTSFDRPGFRHLLTLVETKQIDTVLVKDLSRLGRDYIQTGHYIERYFPERQIRFIAVNDNIDSGLTNAANEIAPFLSVFNDLYARDISKKVRTALQTKKEAGQFIGSSAPFGYLKDSQMHGHLIIDPVGAPVVRLIFQMFLEFGSVRSVAKALTDRMISTPMSYKQGAAWSKNKSWSDTMIRRILTNPSYAGHLTQNRARKLGYKIDKKINLPPQAWIVVKHTHEAIISQEQFDKTQTRLQKRSYRSKAAGEGHLLSGLVFCGDCGGSMTFLRQTSSRSYLVCRAFRTGAARCDTRCTREEALQGAITEMLGVLLGNSEVKASAHYNELCGIQRQSWEKKLMQCRQAMTSLYIDRVEQLISMQQYQQLNQSFLETEEETTRQLMQLDEMEKTVSPQAQSTQEIHRGFLLETIKKIVVYADKPITVWLAFSAYPPI